MPPCRGDCKRVVHEQRRGGTLTVDVNSRERAEQIRAMIDAHWAAWPDMALPALNGLTPREASRTPDGRELLEALFAQFEQLDARALRGSNPLLASGPRIAALRREFGMD